MSLGTARVVMGVASGLGLLALGAAAVGPGEIRAPGLVVAADAWSLAHAGDGVVRWRRLDGATPGGPVVTDEGVYVAERAGPLDVRLEPSAADGAVVSAGDRLARLELPALAAELQAAAQAVKAATAEAEALASGGRAGLRAAARARVEEARASLAQAEQLAEVVAGLAARGAAGSQEATQAALAVAVRQRALAVAQAEVAVAHDLPLAPEQAAAEGRVAEAVGRYDAAAARLEAFDLRTPLGGTVSRPGGEVLLVVHGDQRLVQVAIPERAAGGLSEGAPVRFSRTDGQGDTTGALVARGAAAHAGNAGPQVWAVVRLDAPLPVGSTGVAHVEAPWW